MKIMDKIKKELTDQENIKRLLMVVLSALVYSISMNFFVTRGNLFPGGFSGLSRIIIGIFAKFFGINIPFGVFYFGLNIIPTILVYKFVGHKFTIFSMLQFSLVAFFTLFIPKLCLTDDLLLIAIFGGILGGSGISIALKNNASSGGTDFVAMYASGKFNISVWNHIMIGNAVVLVFAGLLFGWDKALYSIIYQFCSTQVIKTFHDRYKYRTLHIITEHGDEVCDELFRTVRHGITRMEGRGAYRKMPQTYLYMTINAYQVREVVEAIKKVDPKAFININITEKIIGNYYQKPLD